MERTGLWHNSLCPCCQLVPESSTSHLYLCPSPTIATLREKLYKDILMWLKEVNTEPSLLHLITSLWYARQPDLPTMQSPQLRKIWCTLVDIGTQSMWKGFIPNGMCDLQHEHYKLTGH